MTWLNFGEEFSVGIQFELLKAYVTQGLNYLKANLFKRWLDKNCFKKNILATTNYISTLYYVVHVVHVVFWCRGNAHGPRRQRRPETDYHNVYN